MYNALMHNNYHSNCNLFNFFMSNLFMFNLYNGT